MGEMITVASDATRAWAIVAGRVTVSSEVPRMHSGNQPVTSCAVRSCQNVFSRSISEIFFDRRQPLISFSRACADSNDSATSHQTSWFVRYFVVKLGVRSALCCPIRAEMSRVMPV